MAQKRKERGLYKTEKSPNWYYDFSHDGVRYQGSTKATSLTLARDILNAKRAEVLRGGAGIRHGGKSPKFFTLLENYLNTSTEKKSHVRDITTAATLASFFGNRKLTTMENNEVLLRGYIKARGEAEIDVTHVFADGKIARAEQIKSRKPIKRTSINRELALLKTIFNRGIEWNMCSKNPVKKGMISQRAELEARRNEFLELDEIEAYLNACAPQFYPAAFAMLHTGMRSGEVKALEWSDIDFEQRTIHIKKDKAGKGRTVFMTEPLTQMLKSLKSSGQTGRVFLNRDGNPYKDFRSAHKHAMLRSGLADKRETQGKPPLNVHDLRHTAGTWLAASSKDLLVVKEFLGHRDMSTTLRYSHLIEDHARGEAERLSAMFAGENKFSRGKNAALVNIGDRQQNAISEKTALNKE